MFKIFHKYFAYGFQWTNLVGLPAILDRPSQYLYTHRLVIAFLYILSVVKQAFVKSVILFLSLLMQYCADDVL